MLNIDEVTRDDPVVMGSYCNEYYSSISTRVQRNMAQTDPDFGLDLGNIEHEPLSNFDPITDGELAMVISRLKNNILLSEIPTKFLKLFNLKLVPILRRLFNRCLEESHYPLVLKKATIVPHFKSGNRRDIQNYRPVSHLPILNKTFETLLHDRLYTYVVSHNIISTNQFGYMGPRSTTQGALQVVNQVLPAINQNLYSVILLIDLSKAFDGGKQNFIDKEHLSVNFIKLVE